MPEDPAISALAEDGVLAFVWVGAVGSSLMTVITLYGDQRPGAAVAVAVP